MLGFFLGFFFSKSARYWYPLAVGITVTVVHLAGKQQTAEGCWLAGSYGKTRQGNGEAIRAVAEHRGDMPCLPAGATTRLTFVRPVLRPGPAGTNETPDLPTRGPTARSVPL
ncbi:hypothetical protein X777_16712 [Ooceraea biroi]|uniref:Uncharacterized protein n=1 Tax=Ooceraea biroi TaxID=2015173 RepID=A0A026VTP2_OOCBI|nr:hypothetical protein X777_16712 [Ooceraea biroi]